jgi:hypothetical protein
LIRFLKIWTKMLTSNLFCYEILAKIHVTSYYEWSLTSSLVTKFWHFRKKYTWRQIMNDVILNSLLGREILLCFETDFDWTVHTTIARETTKISFKFIWKKDQIKNYKKFFFFGVTCFFWLSLLFFCFSAIKWYSLYASRTQGSNPRRRTMAQTVSPRCSPLDQGTSLIKNYIKFANE